MTSITALQEEIAALLNADDTLAQGGVKALAENRLDVEASIDAALVGVGIVATVVTPDIAGMGVYEGEPVGEVEELVVSVAEICAVNRERPGAMTALDAAIRAATLLHSATRTFKAIRQSYEEQRGLVICNASFATSVAILLTNQEE